MNNTDRIYSFERVFAGEIENLRQNGKTISFPRDEMVLRLHYEMDGISYNMVLLANTSSNNPSQIEFIGELVKHVASCFGMKISEQAFTRCSGTNQCIEVEPCKNCLEKEYGKGFEDGWG